MARSQRLPDNLAAEITAATDDEDRHGEPRYVQGPLVHVLHT
jgi:hypothetical protein